MTNKTIRDLIEAAVSANKIKPDRKDGLGSFQYDRGYNHGLKDGVKIALNTALEQLLAEREWQSMDSAPRDGTEFLTTQKGEIYHTKYDQYERIMFRKHQLHEPKTYVNLRAQYRGEEVEARHLIDAGKEEFQHFWCFWTRGFEFEPTHWKPITPPQKEEE